MQKQSELAVSSPFWMDGNERLSIPSKVLCQDKRKTEQRPDNGEPQVGIRTITWNPQLLRRKSFLKQKLSDQIEGFLGLNCIARNLGRMQGFGGFILEGVLPPCSKGVGRPGKLSQRNTLSQSTVWTKSSLSSACETGLYNSYAWIWSRRNSRCPNMNFYHVQKEHWLLKVASQCVWLLCSTWTEFCRDRSDVHHCRHVLSEIRPFPRLVRAWYSNSADSTVLGRNFSVYCNGWRAMWRQLRCLDIPTFHLRDSERSLNGSQLEPSWVSLRFIEVTSSKYPPRLSEFSSDWQVHAPASSAGFSSSTFRLTFL
jgi:hypothetical protein